MPKLGHNIQGYVLARKGHGNTVIDCFMVIYFYAKFTNGYN